MPFILEGLVSSTNADGSPHLAPMGPETDAAMAPPGAQAVSDVDDLSESAAHRAAECFTSPTTSSNWPARRSACWSRQPRWLDDHPIEGGWILADACRWYAFRIGSIDDRAERVRMEAEVVERGTASRFLRFQSRPACRARSGDPGDARSSGCRRTKSLLNLTVCGHWSKRRGGRRRSVPGRFWTNFFPAGASFGRVTLRNQPQVESFHCHVRPRCSSPCSQPIAFWAVVVWRLGRAAVWRRRGDGRRAGAVHHAAAGRAAFGGRSAGRTGLAFCPAGCRELGRPARPMPAVAGISRSSRRRPNMLAWERARSLAWRWRRDWRPWPARNRAAQ